MICHRVTGLRKAHHKLKIIAFFVLIQNNVFLIGLHNKIFDGQMHKRKRFNVRRAACAAAAVVLSPFVFTEVR